ncbi:MAG: hypothetical protein QOG82_1590 [Actinomycetota bacterium]|jgi:hypothetical protein|nr:hypothetical protein [Actinomycetota bacterium]
MDGAVAGHAPRFIAKSQESGQWPVIVGNRPFPGDDELARFVEDASADGAPSATDLLAAAAALDPQDVLRRGWQGSLPTGEDAQDPAALEVYDESPPDRPVPPIPQRLTPWGMATIALIPAATSEAAVAVLGWGNWNACPRPEEHVAVLRRWRILYGAQLKALSPDTMELVVANPPGTIADALTLAREHYAYAPDIVDQGEHSTIGALAAALVGTSHWHFWWD